MKLSFTVECSFLQSKNIKDRTFSHANPDISFLEAETYFFKVISIAMQEKKLVAEGFQSLEECRSYRQSHNLKDIFSKKISYFLNIQSNENCIKLILNTSQKSLSLLEIKNLNPDDIERIIEGNMVFCPSQIQSKKESNTFEKAFEYNWFSYQFCTYFNFESKNEKEKAFLLLGDFFAKRYSSKTKLFNRKQFSEMLRFVESINNTAFSYANLFYEVGSEHEMLSCVYFLSKTLSLNIKPSFCHLLAKHGKMYVFIQVSSGNIQALDLEKGIPMISRKSPVKIGYQSKIEDLPYDVSMSYPFGLSNSRINVNQIIEII